MKNTIKQLSLLVFLIAVICVPVITLEAAGWNFSDHAPEFRRDIEWLNVSEPVQLRKLQGKFVLLHFWSASSPACLDDLPVLKKWDEQYADRLIVIGIYSPYFTAERNIQNVRNAVLRYGIDYPVANDPDLLIWRDYHVSLWPTQVLISPLGKIIAKGSGESFNEQVASILAEHHGKAAGYLSDSVVQQSFEKLNEPSRILNFPTRILADQIKDRLFISDTGHHRVIITDLSGQILEIIGNGKPGSANGSFSESVFDQPQGLALQEEFLYVADSGNHLIRRVDLKNRIVTTIAGTGKNYKNLNLFGDAIKADLDTPVDLAIVGDSLYIAMAGNHQILYLNFKDNRIRVFAGTGKQSINDGPLRMSSLAQPSGLSTDGKNIYFSDSVVSAVRSAEIIPSGYVRTIMGYDFFVYGDRDGDRGWTRLQYPNGILYLPDGLLAVADTYNNKIKLIDKTALRSSTLSGSGEIGSADGSPDTTSYNQPQGLAFKQNKIYVADTNNHLIRVIDLQDRKVSTMVLKLTKEMNNEQAPNTVDLKGERVPIAKECSDHIRNIKFRITLPPEHKFLSEGMNNLKLFSGSGRLIKSFKIKDLKSDLNVVDTVMSNRAFAQATLYYCHEGNKGICKVKTILFEVPVKPNLNQQDCELNYTVLP